MRFVLQVFPPYLPDARLSYQFATVMPPSPHPTPLCSTPDAPCPLKRHSDQNLKGPEGTAAGRPARGVRAESLVLGDSRNGGLPAGPAITNPLPPRAIQSDSALLNTRPDPFRVFFHSCVFAGRTSSPNANSCRKHRRFAANRRAESPLGVYHCRWVG